MYHHPSFESHLRYWANRLQFANLLTDIYDSDIWKTLKKSSKVDLLNFFQNDVADFHLGLMLNLD